MIFFDLDGTLLDFKGAEFLAVLAFHNQFSSLFNFSGNQSDFYREWCSIGKKHYSRFLQGELSFEQQKIARMKELIGELQDCEAAEYFQFYLKSFEYNWRPYEDVIPCLQSLKGNRLGIITNGDLNQQKQKLERMGILEYFEVVIASGDVGVSKPNTRIFEVASEMTGQHLHAITYIGDDFSTDIAPCEKLNMRGIWLNRQNERLERPVQRMITTLDNLYEHL
ncbi:HAD family hydrolase [Paenibacillus arenilitoris]|uniref:HAD family hydrolase n=1 Tax=Paenibacillus arenilitoris TaxID=2772299 RepID=A0A927CM16_9BACL|nr:HAD family hydrolase [Paenibacillus arenilitoris]MBD2869063.1 HAD family hydrolase [Paenibacillus arenilitoris]